ncbi:hypothetical protein HUT13_22465 [Streptomyces harbinensis]|uniref:hypothetical protein n=1 Tax=Streptomyces harbinensis TaxID=1176198 RepID=UPI001590755E|nr:hypothetical protein [Streptomyces harbinensis]QKV71218.1 hypothetical protein HUT13_22465 [Streptomyces harbinensis]
MADRFADQEAVYAREIAGLPYSENWVGLSAINAMASFGKTKEMFQAAHEEARQIAELLREAHGEFERLRNLLRSVVAEAEAAGMKISAEEGRATADPAKVDNMYFNDPQYQQQLRSAETAWTEDINRYVQAIIDYDSGLRVSLEHMAEESRVFGELGSGESGGHDRIALGMAVELARRISSGDASAEDIEKLEIILAGQRDENGQYEVEFAQEFMDELGAESLVLLANSISPPGAADSSSNGIQEDLAQLVAGAMVKGDDSRFYDRWMLELDQVGRDDHPNGPDGMRVRGYQTFVTLLQHGSGYEEYFLHDLGDQIIAAEDYAQGGDPGIWRVDIDRLGEDGEWFANDPLDSLLGIMSQQPDVATTYLDPGQNGENEPGAARLQYLLGDDGRNWNVLTHERPIDGEPVSITFPVEDPAGKTGLGLALEAATTGRLPDTSAESFGYHTIEQARIMDSVIEMLDGDDGRADIVLADDSYANLRDPLNRALADYTADTFNILSGQSDHAYSGGSTYVDSEGRGRLGGSTSQVIRMLRGVSGEVDDYKRLYDAQLAYSTEQLVALPDAEYIDGSMETWNEWSVTSRAIGEVMGTMNGVGADMILDGRDMAIGEINDTARYAYHGFGAPITGIPFIGDTSQRLLDAYLYEWSKPMIEEVDIHTRNENSAANDAADTNLVNLYRAWAESAGYGEGDAGRVHFDAASGEAVQSRAVGRDRAMTALRN